MSPWFWCLSKISPFETTRAKLFTKVRHSQTTLRGGGKSQGRYMKESKGCTITRSQWEQCPWKCNSELMKSSMLRIYPLDSKRANVSGFLFCFKKWHTALSPFGWFLLNPSKKKQTQFKQTRSSDLRSNIYNNQMEYQICFLLLLFIYFLQTDTTTNTELKPLFGSSICKIESVFTEDSMYVVSSRRKRKQSYETLNHTCSCPSIWSYPVSLETLEFQSLPG